MQLIRHSFGMLIEMDEAPHEPVSPEVILIRTTANVDKDIKTICRVDIKAFKDHFGYIEQSFDDELAMFENWLKNDESLNDPSLWFLAMDGEETVGYALCAVWDHENRDFGHVSGLGVLRPYRRRGIGLALLRHAFSEYYQRGKRGVSLGVDAENLAGVLNLYKKARMHVHRQFDLYEKELRPRREISVESLEN
jgi:ribosomal protein S18 acetylase RimI-like enzyme